MSVDCVSAKHSYRNNKFDFTFLICLNYKFDEELDIPRVDSDFLSRFSNVLCHIV